MTLLCFSVSLMPFSPQFLVELVPYLVHLVVGRLSLVKLFPRCSLSIPLGAYSDGCDDRVVWLIHCLCLFVQYSNSDTVVYVGCGERGNEMAEVYISLTLFVNPVLWFLRFFYLG